MDSIRKSSKIRMHFHGIHPSAWEHPADKVALKSLQKVPGLDTVIKAVLGATSEKSLRLITLASAVRVNEKQFADIHALYMETCEVFGIEKIPELYISQNPFLNASAIGWDNPFIVLNSSMVEVLNDEELIGLMAHELGHILSGHVLYKTLLRILLQISQIALTIPLTGVALMGIIAALQEWDRKSELSADRAGLLATQDPEVAIHLLMKMAGGRQIDKMNLGEFIKQAEEYHNANTLSDSLYKFMAVIGRSHPFPVTRLLELMNWVRSGEYDSIIRGFYKKEASSFEEDFQKASEGYKNDISNTIKPIMEDMRESAESASKKAREMFDEILGQMGKR